MQLDADDLAPGAARAAVRRAAEPLRDVALGDIELVTSELVANAVEYGVGESVGFGVRIEDARHMEVRVTNAVDLLGAGEPFPSRPWTMPDPLQVRGRGLAVVEVLAAEAEVQVNGNSVEVRAVVPV